MTRREDEMTLAEQTTRLLLLAGIPPDDPALTRIREWNTRAYKTHAAEKEAP